MADFLAQIATILGGVVGISIGFVVIVLVFALLLGPYAALTWRRPRRTSGPSDPLRPVDERRY